MIIALLVAQLAAPLLLALVLAWWLWRRLSARWSIWGWGALAFVSSQAPRIPLLLGDTHTALGTHV